ncbi:hypothetical protein IG631_15862 [Alternaria alternata]|nr:hypothetical protein IG631_15862 [Alternaria alternata]
MHAGTNGNDYSAAGSFSCALFSNARCGENTVKLQLPRRKMWGRVLSSARTTDHVYVADNFPPPLTAPGLSPILGSVQIVTWIELC